MTFTNHLAIAVLAFAATAASAQPQTPASGEMPFADTTVTQTTAPTLTREAVRATAMARDLEVGDVARPSHPQATPAPESAPRFAKPASQPLSGERA